MDKLPTTIEELAAMLYKHMASKEDINRVEHIQKEMLEELTATHEDVRYVRNTVTMLVTSVAAHEAANESLRKRVERVERKVGIAK
jgi:hypothetical protein